MLHFGALYICSSSYTCVLVLFIVSPTILLIMYPTRLFRKCVSCCGFHRWHALQMFVESFQGQYKDGTNGTHDFKMVSASFLILRIPIVSLFANRHYSSYISILYCLLLACASCFYALTRPYIKNYADIVSVELLVATYRPATKAPFADFVLILTLMLYIPYVVLIFYICYVFAKKTGIPQCLK